MKWEWTRSPEPQSLSRSGFDCPGYFPAQWGEVGRVKGNPRTEFSLTSSPLTPVLLSALKGMKRQFPDISLFSRIKRRDFLGISDA